MAQAGKDLPRHTLVRLCHSIGRIGGFFFRGCKTPVCVGLGIVKTSSLASFGWQEGGYTSAHVSAHACIKLVFPLLLSSTTTSSIHQFGDMGRGECGGADAASGAHTAHCRGELIKFRTYVAFAQAWAGVDVAALAQYLAHTLRAGEAFDLLLLKELVSVMTVCALPLLDTRVRPRSNKKMCLGRASHLP